jgi:hypothetical protein
MGSTDRSDIRVVVDTGDHYSVKLEMAGDYDISITQGDNYHVLVETPTTIVEDADIYFRVADLALTAISASFAQTASYANVALQVLQANFTGSFSGSFAGTHTGDGSLLVFNTLNTSQSSDSVLVVGNIYNDYENKQTTVFKNGDVVVSGSTYIGEDGLLVFSPREAPDTFISGGMFYSSSGEFFLGATQ